MKVVAVYFFFPFKFSLSFFFFRIFFLLKFIGTCLLFFFSVRLPQTRYDEVIGLCWRTEIVIL